MSKNFSAKTGGPWSMGVPDPLNDLPSISMLMGMRNTSPVNSTWVCRLSMPEVPSKIYERLRVWGYAWCPYLNDGSLSGNFKDLTLSDGSISKSDIDDLCISIWAVLGAIFELTWGTWHCQEQRGDLRHLRQFCNQLWEWCCSWWWPL